MAAETHSNPAWRDQDRSRPRGARLAVLAARQHGVVAHRQLIALGLSASAIGRRAQTGSLHRVHRAVYAVGHRRPTEEGRAMAAVLSGGGSTVLGHVSAAALRGWLPAVRGPMHIIEPRSRIGDRGLRVHVSLLREDERALHDGIPITEAMRTLVDLASVLSSHRLQRAADLAGVAQPDRRRRLERLAQRHRGRRGITRLRSILAAAERDAAVTRSVMEDRLVAAQLCALLDPADRNRI